MKDKISFIFVVERQSFSLVSDAEVASLVVCCIATKQLLHRDQAIAASRCSKLLGVSSCSEASFLSLDFPLYACQPKQKMYMNFLEIFLVIPICFSNFAVENLLLYGKRKRYSLDSAIR